VIAAAKRFTPRTRESGSPRTSAGKTDGRGILPMAQVVDAAHRDASDSTGRHALRPDTEGRVRYGDVIVFRLPDRPGKPNAHEHREGRSQSAPRNRRMDQKLPATSEERQGKPVADSKRDALAALCFQSVKATLRLSEQPATRTRHHEPPWATAFCSS